MLLHSIVPFDMIFGNEADKNTELKQVKGGYIEVNTASGVSQISRVISTDPKMYLSKEYKIGDVFKE